MAATTPRSELSAPSYQPLMHSPSLPHARVHHARSRTAFRTLSMLGPSSVARLRRSRAEFRQNRHETNAVKLQKMLSEASTAAMWRLGA